MYHGQLDLQCLSMVAQCILNTRCFISRFKIWFVKDRYQG